MKTDKDYYPQYIHGTIHTALRLKLASDHLHREMFVTVNKHDDLVEAYNIKNGYYNDAGLWSVTSTMLIVISMVIMLSGFGILATLDFQNCWNCWSVSFIEK